MKYTRPILIILAILMAGCGAPQGKTGEITLDSPPDGAIIYSSSLIVAGTAQGVNSGGFIVTVVDSSGTVLTRKEAGERDSTFNYELIHGYSGEPIAATIVLTAADAPDEAPYSVANVTLASLEHRPEGAFLDVLTPQTGDETGGDEIVVAGRVSGIEDRRFTVELIGSDGAVIDTQIVTLPPSYIADDLPWQAALEPGDVTGSAVVRVVSESGEQLASVAVVLSAAAG